MISICLQLIYDWECKQRDASTCKTCIWSRSQQLHLVVKESRAQVNFDFWLWCGGTEPFLKIYSTMQDFLLGVGLVYIRIRSDDSQSYRWETDGKLNEWLRGDRSNAWVKEWFLQQQPQNTWSVCWRDESSVTTRPTPSSAMKSKTRTKNHCKIAKKNSI